MGDAVALTHSGRRLTGVGQGVPGVGETDWVWSVGIPFWRVHAGLGWDGIKLEPPDGVEACLRDRGRW